MQNKPQLLIPNHNPTPGGSGLNWTSYHLKVSLKAAMNNYAKALGSKDLSLREISNICSNQHFLEEKATDGSVKSL